MAEAKGKEISVVAHCILNPCTRVKGLLQLNYEPAGSVIQLPCPEAIYLGLDRWAVTRNQIDVPEFRRFCSRLIEPYADLMEMLASKGYSLKIVGVCKSPSCGVRTTTSGYSGGRVRASEHEHIAGMGVFMDVLAAELGRRGVSFEIEEV
jgi:predicted secreted protein